MKPIFLWGFMGAGKSKLGRRLAKYMELDYKDLDNEIEKWEGRSISNIFNENGEEAFRNYETKQIELLKNEQDIIISCGGGTPCFNDNHKLMNKMGLTIFLSVDTNELAKRLKKSKKKRPLLKSLNSDSKLKSYVESTLQNRMQYYKTAHLVFEYNSFKKKKVQALAESILLLNSNGSNS